MSKRGATSISCVVLLIIGAVACGESTQVDIPSSKAASSTGETAQDVTEPLHTTNQFDDWGDSFLPIAQVSIYLDGEVNPDEFPYQREWMPASIMVISDGEITHQGRVGIHVRGNTSRDFDKKSYAFETWNEDDEDLDVALLGLPAEEDWVLQGPFSDKTLIRNHLIYQLSRDIGRYAARTRFVELEINGDYRGVYVLMEKIKRDDVRVALPEGAALIKRDWVEGGEQ
ncbi:MAG: CotH kinase family protein, partial [Actinomycetota bacterium]|nr:CotH kinase family protein [Actinomycetota bacterium]